MNKIRIFLSLVLLILGKNVNNYKYFKTLDKDVS